MPEESELTYFVELSINNITSIADCCRACLRIDSDLTSIGCADEDMIKLRDKLSACVSEVYWDRAGVQSFICHECVTRLRNAYDFRNVCLQSDQALQKCFLQTSSNEKGDELRALNTPTKFEFITTGTTPKLSIIHEESQNTDYMNVKHFLDAAEERKNKIKLIDNTVVSPSSSTDMTQGHLNDDDDDDSEEQGIDEVEKENTSKFLKPQLDSTGQSVARTLTKVDSKCNIREENSDEIDDPAVVVETIPLLHTAIIKTDNVFKKDTGIQVRVEPKEDTSKPYVCSECGKCYRKNSNLSVHMRTHTGEKPYECKYCEKRFYHSSHLREHIRRHTGEKPFQCSVCSKRFTIRGELTMHMRSHTGHKPFACNVCDRRCLSSADLKVHMRTHTGEKPFECDTCGKKFASTYILTSHIKTHTGERPHVCNICKKSFTQSSHLKVHQRKHTGEKVNCKVCAAQFAHSSQLTVHMREHTGKQPYRCHVCNKVCNYSSELLTHMMKHTGEKFSCLTCDKKFTSANYLQEHMRTHTGQNLSTCSVCNRQFTRSQYLEKHMRTHTGEKPYTCFICGKGFTQSSSLKVHIRIHTGNKPYICDLNLCDKKFNSSSDLANHQKRHKKMNA